jgi:hypothetical protein
MVMFGFFLWLDTQEQTSNAFFFLVHKFLVHKNELNWQVPYSTFKLGPVEEDLIRLSVAHLRVGTQDLCGTHNGTVEPSLARHDKISTCSPKRLELKTAVIPNGGHSTIEPSPKAHRIVLWMHKTQVMAMGPNHFLSKIFQKERVPTSVITCLTIPNGLTIYETFLYSTEAI